MLLTCKLFDSVSTSNSEVQRFYKIKMDVFKFAFDYFATPVEIRFIVQPYPKREQNDEFVRS